MNVLTVGVVLTCCNLYEPRRVFGLLDSANSNILLLDNSYRIGN